MKVMLGRASGATGMPLVRGLHAAGHDVLHRSPDGRGGLAAAGATPIQADVLSAADPAAGTGRAARPR